ncbi:bifunctional methionine sulfoxide reductase B/A protein [Candidatus Dojkabacteria bacterium]|nr:bifunctional methionine sulfoxide reductase B/A protein [Candidatus Dojkabacteria bacterium]
MKYNELTDEEKRIIEDKGTETPFSGIYNDSFEEGIYTCKRCGVPLYHSTDKFKSKCGWPSFDDEIPDAIERTPDSDGKRTEITCGNCGAHLGHVFIGENLTKKNTRHCVNSISMDFIPKENVGKAIFAGGCFWGVEYHFSKVPGVLLTEVGYTGGEKENPTYDQVKTGETGHAEAIKIVYDSTRVSYEKLAKLFFEIHDPTQVNRQGPDIGSQYRSVIFYINDEQKQVAENLKNTLIEKGVEVVTRIRKAEKFYSAEDYHQQYYKKNEKTPYCHIYQKRF